MRPQALATLLILCLAPPLAAQEHPAIERGFSPEKVYQISDVDSVNLLNGGLLDRVAIGPRFQVGGSLDYGLVAIHHSKIWDFEEIVGPLPGPQILVRSMPANTPMPASRGPSRSAN